MRSATWSFRQYQSAAKDKMTIDLHNLQVLANHCSAAADAMAFTLMRTAHSSFIKETEDFSCQIVTPEGYAFSSPRSFGAPWYSGIDYGPVLRMIEAYDPGDICITNDPYSGYVCTHTPDVHIWKPIFYDGRIVCFLVGHIHNTDVGGAVPASLSRSLSEIEQEGIRIPPMKIYRDGVLNEEIARIMRTNVRVPDQNWGDFMAQIASVNVGERKILEIVERFGIDDFVSGMYGLLDYAETQARGIIRSIPDGTYTFDEYADEDGNGGDPCRIALTVRIKGDQVELDYTGSDPQLSSSLNMPTGGIERHPLPLVGLVYVLFTLDTNLILNAGTLRPARAILPEGSVVNCTAPAAVGMRSLTCMVTQIATFGAFLKAVPERLPVSSPGGNSMMNVKTFDRSNRPIMASIGPVGGGGGAAPHGDGVNGSGGASAFLRNTPIEISETEVPIHFRRYGLWPDTAGAGKYRGGLAAVMEFEILTPESVVTARNRNRSLFAAWGAFGGAAGKTSRFLKNPGTDKEVDLGNADVVHCDPGDVIRVVGPAPGGYGLPQERDPALVLKDVKYGFVSVEGAKRDYGVVICNDRVDEEATRRTRSSMAAIDHLEFDFGDNRKAFEAVWNSERYALLTSYLSHTPIRWRHYVKRLFFESVRNQKFGKLGVKGQMNAIWDELKGRFKGFEP